MASTHEFRDVEAWVVAVELAPAQIQVLQVLTILVFAPLLSGWIAHLEARLQGRRGPRILQPYYDLAKLFRKETLVPEDAGWVFVVGPMVAFTCYLTVPLLIPVLTTFPLPLGYMGDILGGGFLLGLAGFSVALAAAETGGPYAQLGSSRAMTFGALIEPSILFVTFAVALVTTTDLPYFEAAAARASLSQVIRPAHLLIALAFFLVVLNDTGRIPVETHAGTLEFGMIDEARTLEHSGPLFALLKWGSAMKQMILYVLLVNVFAAPWGLAGSGATGSVVLAVLALLGKAFCVGAIFAIIDNSFSKLRLFKITEFMAAAFLLSILAVLVLYLGGG
ncbi:MAG: NADH-quinone oxidoreductase subunit H [Actinomycetota bacterium]|nr:NADH-quinone oxidoreductase subunit H [Actinomycetota bacterium]